MEEISQPENSRIYKIADGVIEVMLTGYGATIMSVVTPDRNGNKANVVAGFDNPDDYRSGHPYFGCVVGRFANRIAGGRFTLDGKEIKLSLNEKINQLHGGFEGFNRKTWKVIDADDKSVTFFYRSVDGEEGYPGNLDVKLRYSIKDGTGLLAEYEAITDQPTVVSLTNHSYFNLSGFAEPRIYKHQLQVNADYYTAKNAGNTSTGEIIAVEGTPLDFRQRRPIGDRINVLMEDMGYDHNYVLKNNGGPAAGLSDPLTGRSMNIYTDQPGMQLYSSNWWDGSIRGTHGKPYIKHGAVALETQAFPDAPNQPAFPSAVLRPGETYRRFTFYEFNAG